MKRHVAAGIISTRPSKPKTEPLGSVDSHEAEPDSQQVGAHRIAPIRARISEQRKRRESLGELPEG
jgi:hypothetical protein